MPVTGLQIQIHADKNKRIQESGGMVCFQQSSPSVELGGLYTGDVSQLYFELN